MADSFCPNCGKPAEKIGNKLTCIECDAAFKITQDGTAKVEKTGVIQDLTDRVETLEGKTPAEPDPAGDLQEDRPEDPPEDPQDDPVEDQEDPDLW